MVDLKIKQTRQVRLDELLKYIWENEITSTVFQSCKGKAINVGLTGTISHDPVYYFNKEDLFTITEEVEVTEDMRLYVTLIYWSNVYKRHFSATHKERTIKELTETYDVKFIYLQNEDGRIGELIWTKERGLID